MGWEACQGLQWMVTVGNWTPDPLLFGLLVLIQSCRQLKSFINNISLCIGNLSQYYNLYWKILSGRKKIQYTNWYEIKISKAYCYDNLCLHVRYWWQKHSICLPPFLQSLLSLIFIKLHSDQKWGKLWILDTAVREKLFQLNTASQ